MSKKKKQLPKNESVLTTNNVDENNNNDEVFKFKIKSPYKFTDKQEEFVKIGLDPLTKVFFIKGSAGVSKTFLSVFCALNLFYKKIVNKIIFVRTPIESSMHKLGYMPGDLNEKFNYYSIPFYDKLEELLGKEQALKLSKTEKIKISPNNFLRGMQWDDAVIICDEAQNLDLSELKTLLTRIGKNSKVFICGDISQSDLRNNSKNDFNILIEFFKENKEESIKMGLNFFEFSDEDIVRSEIVKFIVTAFKKLESKLKK